MGDRVADVGVVENSMGVTGLMHSKSISLIP